MEKRLALLRKELGITQQEMGTKLGVTRAAISRLESGDRNLTKQMIKLLCSEFSVNEDWLRYGQGEMFIQPDEFSLDEYAKKSNLSELELDIVKGYMDLDDDVRKNILSHFKSIFDKHSEVAVTKEDMIKNELKSYRLELEAESKGETSSASENLKEKSN